ncbi:uncharacterized protein FA14DRAFT_191765 [Meira miltonrushii]|uniref:Pali-domain-containing protein n=1 Tax=Meira miltonrushii TaxID=1280837 RepID=A0A316V5E6_9BASI|nr:uncharacterized protein FA14DRAFT_191765 [Meira miltonrushii]PWN32682.1 hypothetical protein FA14DRAFT_191765 [Meira miltonrushii]
MRSIAAILIVGSTLFFLASIGLTAKAIADLASTITPTSSSNGAQSTSSSSNGLIGSGSIDSYTGTTPTGSSSIFDGFATPISSNSNLITPSSIVSSTSAGASAITNQNPAPTSFVSQLNQNEDDVPSVKDVSADKSNGIETGNQETENNIEAPLQNLHTSAYRINAVKEYQVNQVSDQPMITAISFPVLRIMPVPAIPSQSSLQRRLMLSSDTNETISSSNGGDIAKHHSIILLVLFSIQEALLGVLLAGGLAYLWRYNTIDFNAEYRSILSRQAETRDTHSRDDALVAARKRTTHIRTYLIFFCAICLSLLAFFVSSFVLLGMWFTVKDNLTIITIALDALTFFFLVMICVAMFYDLRRSKKEEQYTISDGVHGAVFMNGDTQRMKHLERAPSVVSSIKSLSSFSTPPGWSRDRFPRRSGKQKGGDRKNEGQLPTQIEQRQDEERSDMHDQQIYIAHSQQPTESYDQPFVPAHPFQPGMNSAQYVGQPLRRLSALQDTSHYRSHQSDNIISPPIGTPPPQPGMDINASYPSHMLASLPSPSSAGHQDIHFSHQAENDDENDEDREEWIGSITDAGKEQQKSSNQRRQRRPSPNKIPIPPKPSTSLPHSPVSESPSSVYSDVLLSPGTLCVAVPNIHGGTTMMPVSVGQSHQTTL